MAFGSSGSVKLIVQIPCYNEEGTIAETIAAIPRKIDGVGKVEVLVIDDGSKDRTIDVAKKAGADHILVLKNHKGLAQAFKIGLDSCLKRGADIIVNTDGDHQYRGENIPSLIQPILDHEADIVIGERPIEQMKEFSWVKKRSQRIGSYIVRKLSGIEVKDVTSGFRAYDREAAFRINIQTTYTYTWESTIQAGKAFLKVSHTPVTVNPPKRPSRLIRNRLDYVKRFFATIIRIYATFEPLKVFSSIGAIFVIGAIILFVRFWYFFAIGDGAGHVQSLIFGAVLAFVGIQNFTLGLIGDLIASNRRLLDDTLYRVKKIELEEKPQRFSANFPSFR